MAELNENELKDVTGGAGTVTKYVLDCVKGTKKTHNVIREKDKADALKVKKEGEGMTCTMTMTTAVA